MVESTLKERDTPECGTVLYILQINKSKLNQNSMKILKCLLLHIIQTTNTKTINLEVYFDQNEFNPIHDHIGAILKMLVTGYNLLEPEHTRDYPLIAVNIILPQVFSMRSTLLSDEAITHVYYNSETNPEQVEKLVEERNAD